MKKILAFLKKDFLCESSYKISFIFNIIAVLTTVLIYYFIDRLFGQRITPHLAPYGTSYFSYVLISLAFFGYIGTGMGSFAAQIQREQIQGTWEAVMLTPTPLTTVLFAMGTWNFLLATLDIVIYALLGLFVFRLDLSRTHWPALLLVTFFSVTSFSALGILSSAFIIVFKRGNPVSWIVNSVEGLIGGVYFPITVLPAWLQACANFLPITYAIRAIQLAVHKGYGLRELKTELLFLCLFTGVLLPLALLVFRCAVQKAKRIGSLAQY